VLWLLCEVAHLRLRLAEVIGRPSVELAFQDTADLGVGSRNWMWLR